MCVVKWMEQKFERLLKVQFWLICLKKTKERGIMWQNGDKFGLVMGTAHLNVTSLLLRLYMFVAECAGKCFCGLILSSRYLEIIHILPHMPQVFQKFFRVTQVLPFFWKYINTNFATWSLTRILLTQRNRWLYCRCCLRCL